MRRMLVLALTAAPVVAGTTDALAAQATTDRRCYLQAAGGATSVRLDAAGLPVAQSYAVALDGQPLQGGAGTTSPLGAMTGTLSVPALEGGEQERRFTAGVTAAGISATTAFTVTRLTAGFRPTQGDPRSLRVRFAVHGFALRDERDATVDPTPRVYVHYVAPGGRLRQTVRLGTARGDCGAIARTAQRRLFPFAPRSGTWRLQFDTAWTYRRGTRDSPFLFSTVAVRVRRTD